MSRERTLSIRQEHLLLEKLEAAGLTAEDAQSVIASRGNKLATTVVQFIRNGDLPIPANGGGPASSGLPVPASAQAASPRFSAESGEFKTPAELNAALDEAGLAYFEPYIRETFLPRLTLCQEPGSVGAYPVTPREIGNKRNPLFRDFYDTQLPKHGYSRPVREYGALLILKLARQLKETGDCDLKVGEYFIVLTDPLSVDARGYQYFLYVRRNANGLYLDYCWFSPDHEISLDYPCLSAHK